MHPRRDLEWYVDSGLQYFGGDAMSGTISFTNVTREDLTNNSDPVINFDTIITVTSNNHNLSDGDVIKFKTQENYPFLLKTAFEVADATQHTFTLKVIGSDFYLSLIHI